MNSLIKLTVVLIALTTLLPYAVSKEYDCGDGNHWTNITNGKTKQCGYANILREEERGDGTYWYVRLKCQEFENSTCYEISGRYLDVNVYGPCIEGAGLRSGSDEIEFESTPN